MRRGKSWKCDVRTLSCEIDVVSVVERKGTMMISFVSSIASGDSHPKKECNPLIVSSFHGNL